MKIEGIQTGNYLSTNNLTKGQGSQEVKYTPIGIKKLEEFPIEKAVNVEELDKAIDKANKSFKTFDRRFEFSVHERLKTFMVKVIDSNTDEVIREIPPEKLLDIIANMLEVAGILVDEKI